MSWLSLTPETTIQAMQKESSPSASRFTLLVLKVPMPKLKTIKPLVGTIKPLVGRMSGEKARDEYRSNTQPWRAWYKTAEWERLRRGAFERDLYTCQRSGEICAGTGNDPNAPVANHKVPHRGDPVLFWDINNIETVTKRIHDSLIQAEEKRLVIGI